MPFNPRYQSLDAWRGIACVAIAWHHAGFLLNRPEDGNWSQIWACQAFQSLNLGVPLFFVISGYCIAASLDAHRRRGQSAWHFLRRRFWRIYPPYWAALAYFVVVVGGLNWLGWAPIQIGRHSLHLEPPGRLTWDQWVGNLTLTETWRWPLLGGTRPLNLTRISWTLCCEQLLYLTGFVLLLVGRRRLFGALGIGFGVVLVGYFLLADVGWSRWRDAAFGQAWYQFAVGVAVYWRLVEAQSAGGRRAVEGALVLLFLVSSNRAVWAGAMLGLILIALRPADNWLTGWGALAPLRACGTRCYSIYLIHLPIGVVVAEAAVQAGLTSFWARALVAAPLAALISIAAGWPFFWLVEARFCQPSVLPTRAGRTSDRPTTGKPLASVDLAPRPNPVALRAEPGEGEGESTSAMVALGGST